MENLDKVESLIGGAGGEILHLPDGDLTLREYLEKTEDRLRRLEERLTELYEGLQSRSKQELRKIALLRGVLVAENQRLSVLVRASETKHVTLIEGWIPDRNVESAISELKENVDYLFIDTRKPELAEEPPTKLRNPAAIRPFQLVVNLFGAPRYREWDPTPIVSYSFAFFFGLMIADVVYGALLMLIGKFLLPRFFGGDPQSEGMKLFQRLIYTSSGVALVLGLLTGNYLGDIYSFFGIESLALASAVQQMLQNPLTFVVLALFIGFIHVNIAHIITLIKGIKEKNTGAILSKSGLLALQFGALYIIRTMVNIDIPSVLNGVLHLNLPVFAPQVYEASFYFAIIGVALIAVGNLKERGGLGSILWLFDITGLLGDIMSYSRLAGVGLATFYLAQAFNMLATVLAGLIPVSGVAGVVGSTILAVVIIIVGHAINVLLGLITGFVHSLRLCFVEFLIKFYEGGGLRYSPFRLIKRPSVIVGTKS
jgi:V/A-type H+-transporting ATPase subunit I